MIPVMMYTSQEGELYMSQARALGAVGVLPKTVKQADVSRTLYQLRLLPERRDGRAANQSQSPQEAASAVQIDAGPGPSIGEIETAVRNAMAPALKEQTAELRRFVLAGLEAFARRINETRPPATPAQPEVEPVVEPPPAPPSRWPLVAVVAAVALIPTVILGALYTRTLNTTRELLRSNASLTSVVQEQQTQLASLQRAAEARAASTDVQAPTAGKIDPESVPYGEAPLSGARLERLRKLLEELKSGGFHGKIRVASYVGDFCLTGNGIEGYSVAAEDLPFRRCDVVGNPFEDSLNSAQRQSLAFANLISSVRQETADALSVEVAYEGRRPGTVYPDGERLARTTAGEWNRIAGQNNRVEFSMIPAT
jgi:hypothetical protein